MGFARMIVLASAILVLCVRGVASFAEAQTVLGSTSSTLDGSHASLCSRETALGNVIANAMKEEAGADIAIINCGAIKGGITFLAGAKISAEDAATLLPSGKLVVAEMTGLDLLTLLEQAFSTLGVDDGRFPQVSGVRLDVNTTKTPGTRVVKATVGGEAIDLTRSYRIATTDELAAGQLGYTQFASSKVIASGTTAVSLADAFAGHVRKLGQVNAKAFGRIKILP